MHALSMIFPIGIIVAVVLYIYYKVAILRTKDELTQHYFNAKSRICLGVFMIFFGIQQYLFYQTKIALFITIVFIGLGALQLNHGVKETRHYRKEWRRLNPENK